MRRSGLGIRMLVLLVGAAALAAPGTAGAVAANDDFANATSISTLPFTSVVSNAGATLEVGEPQPTCRGGGITGTLWYRFVPPVSTIFVSQTTGSDFDTFLVVWQGTTLGGLTQLTCNDNIAFGRTDSQVYFPGTAGQTYYLQVGGVLGTEGNLNLTFDLEAPIPPPCVGCPTFSNYPAPNSFPFAHRAGEPTIGVNPQTNNAMFLMLRDVARVSWDDSQSPAVATWTDVTYKPNSTRTNDPILWTDPVTGRTFVVHLVASCCSIAAYTDDDGATWQLTEPPAVPPSWDHQTIGGGPYPAPLTGANPIYANALYYCAQLAISQCARSDDGGLTWGAPLLMNALQCGGLHGHVAVDAVGAVYLPHKDCAGNRQGVMVSSTLGTTWELRTVPGTRPSLNDPKVAFDAGGRMYFVAESLGRPVVATSDDDGHTWTTPVDVGIPYGIRNTAFPVVTAGDAGRAAFAFLGTPRSGDYQNANFAGAWHLYVSITYDGGATWTTVDATPGDPVQRGCIWLQGGSNNCRNLLDFMDATIDVQGRVLVGYADGCTSADCISFGVRSRDTLGTIARQASGLGLYSAFDPSA